MKLNTQYLVIIIFTLFSFNLYSQVNVVIEGMAYISGSTISDCTTIDFEENSSVTVQFGVTLEKPSSYVAGTSNLRIFTKKTSSDFEVQRYTQTVQESFWSNGDPQFFTASLTITLNASQFNVSGGLFYAEFETSGNFKTSSCNYSIEKDEVPTFTISPSSTTVSCNDNSPKTFTVDNAYNSPGTLTYNWQVGSGWYYNGTAVSNFTTSTNTIQLTPYQFPPSNVKVTPVLDGESYPQLTSNVGIGGFNPAYQIIGDNDLCSTATYTIDNLPAGISVSSWSTSNSNIATISSNGNQATLTATGNGTTAVSATLTNSCGQTKTITKNNIEVGAPSFPNTDMNGDDNVFVRETKTYSAPIASNTTSYYWYFDYGYIDDSSITTAWFIKSGQGTNTITVKVGDRSNSAVVVCRATNSCGNRIKYMYVNIRSTGSGGGGGGGGDPCDDALRLSSNPMKAGNSTNKVIIDPDPCDSNPLPKVNMQTDLATKPQTDFNAKSTVNIFNNYGNLVYTNTQTDTDFDVSHLIKGFYIIKYQTRTGKMITKKLIVE
jgi:hypothetical protein